MAIPTGGLLAFDARGQVGKTMVFSSWRGRNYVRRYVVPSNPRTVDQQAQRSLFSWLSNVWKLAPSLIQEPWFAAAKGRPLTDRNLFNQVNLKRLFQETTIDNFVFSNGANAGIVLDSLSAVDGGGQTIDVTWSLTTLPAGWTLDSVVAAAIIEANPYTTALYKIYAEADNTSPITITVPVASTYLVTAWPKLIKPDGSFAYGPSSENLPVIVA